MNICRIVDTSKFFINHKCILRVKLQLSALVCHMETVQPFFVVHFVSVTNCLVASYKYHSSTVHDNIMSSYGNEHL